NMIKVTEKRYFREPYKLIESNVQKFVNYTTVELTKFIKEIEIQRGYSGYIKIIDIIWIDDTRTTLLGSVKDHE
ncbi:unnamed protein product, partial [marine sediment metagenome]